MIKNILFHIIFLFLFFSPLSRVNAQVNDNLIVSFDQFHRNTYAFAPVLVDTSSKFNCVIGDRSYRGVYSGISSRFLRANYFISSAENKNHALGVQFYQENLGQYIRTNKFYGNYDYRLPISKRYDLSAGINFGFKSLVLDPANAGGGGSASVLSSSFGLGIMSEKLDIVFGYEDFINQLFELPQVEISSPVTYNLYIRFYKQLDLDWKLNTYFLGQLDNLNGRHARGTLLIKWKDLIEAGPGYRSDRGFFIMAGFTNIEWHAISTELYFSYLLIPTLKINSVSNQVLEFTLGINYKK